MKKKIRSIFKLSEGSYIPRLILFAAALALAVTAFTIGVTRIGRKEAGIHTVEYLETGEEAVLYRSGVTLQYNFSGSSSDIRTEMNAIKSVYSSVLGQAYRTLDPDELYSGYTNLAAISQHPGEILTVEEDLYKVLKDAVKKSEEGQGYSLYDGAYRKAWSEIVVLYDAKDFDPLTNQDSMERLQRIREVGSKPDSVQLEFIDDETFQVRLNLSKEYVRMKAELELPDRILDLGLLHDAYMMEMVRKRLEDAGYHKTCLQSESGLTMTGSDWPEGYYVFYSLSEGRIRESGRMPVGSNSAYCMLRRFAMSEDELGFYTLDAGGKTFYRNPYDNVLGDTGEPDPVYSAFTVSYAGDPVGAAYDCLKLFTCRLPDDLKERSAGILSEAAGCSINCNNTVWSEDYEEERVYVFGSEPGKFLEP